MEEIERVKKLREETMASMIECRNALREADGDFSKARGILRKKGALVAAKKTERKTAAGIIASYIHPDERIGVLVELSCETDFVAQNADFKKLGHELAMHVAAMDPMYMCSEDIPPEVIVTEKEITRAQFHDSGKPREVVERIIEGKVQAYSEEHVLLDQPYIRDDSKRVQDLVNEYIARLGENIQVKRFVRYQI